MINAKKYKMLKGTPVAVDGINTRFFEADDVVALHPDTGHGLVRDKIAEEVGGLDDGPEAVNQVNAEPTANLINPDYGTKEHIEKVSDELRKEKKKNGSKKLSDEEHRLATSEAEKHYAQDHAYEGPAIEQVKESDYAEGMKPAELKDGKKK